MASKDFLPGPDARFDLWLANFSSQLSKSGAAFGFSPDELNQMIAASNLFTESFGESRLANDAAKAATASKRDRRRSASSIVRPFARRLQAHPAMTDTIRATFGLSPRATTSGARSLEAPSETPLVALDFGTRGQITIHFGPNRLSLDPREVRRVFGSAIAQVSVQPSRWKAVDRR